MLDPRVVRILADSSKRARVIDWQADAEVLFEAFIRIRLDLLTPRNILLVL